MAQIVNLRTAKKQAAREAARMTANANAAKFGRTKAVKALQMARAEIAEKALDGHRRDSE
jgi:hypothetical protein